MNTIIMSFKMAFSAVWASKVRSFLTMLGIIIGVGAVIILVSLVSSTTKQMKTELESMGTNLISVSITRIWGSTRSVSVEDIEEMVEENSEYISSFTPLVTSSVTMKYGDEDVTSTAYGVSPEYPEIKNRSVEEGRFITEADIENRNKVCLVGQYQVNELFNGQSPVGQEVRLGTATSTDVYTVIGVLDQKSSNVSEGGDDDIIILPYTTAQRFFRNAMITSFAVSATSSDYTSQATAAIESFLYKIFQDDDLYNVQDQAEMVSSIDDALGSMTYLAAGIAGISLVVAGIGIMNIMLVTVTERTKEIGIRKSIGAREGTILTQFLIESAVISGLGGIIGIVLGVGGAAGVCTMMDMPVLTITEQLGTILGSFLFSVAMGIGFGMYPARRAAQMNPVDALRYE
ncbi:MAG: ABC transporter permease [Clostridia bacterium]|nr:ABC transporter permease [Clostridia bacterium]